MGSYRNAVITNQGLDYIAQALAGEIALTFSHMAISDYAYPEGTNLAALTSLQSVKMTVVPASVWVQDTTVGVRGMFSNTTVATEYPINTVGVYATNGTTEILFSVSTATSPDIMEAYNGVAPSSFIFTVQETINEASSLNITVSEAGMATAQDIADLQEQKQERITGAASTITENNLTASRALASDASGKVVVSPVTATELGYLDGVTGNLQTQLNGKQASITGGASTIATTNLTASRALVSNSTGKVAVSSVTATELGRLAGITGNVQEQINSLKTQIVTTAGTNLNNYTEQGIYYFANTVTPTNIPAGVNGYLIVLPSGTGVVRQIWLRGGTTNTNDYMVWVRTNYLNSSETEWGDWVRLLTSKDTLLSGAASTIEKNDLTASRALVSNTSGKVAVSAVTSTELGYLDGVTSNVQTQLNGKQATITGGASTIASSNLTASRALVSNASGKVAASSVTATELGYLSGVTSNIQNQISNGFPTFQHYGEVRLENVDVVNNVNANGGNFTLTHGHWLVVFLARWNPTDSGASGSRAIWLSNSLRGDARSVSEMSIVAPVAGDYTIHQVCMPLAVNDDTTIYMVLKQTSDATIKISTRLTALRLNYM